MTRYLDLDGASGVVSYSMTCSSITVMFRGGATYLYDASTPGLAHVREMQRRARLGRELNTYINKYVRGRYAMKM